MSEAYSREILKRNVAQICQTIGWNGINSTPLDILVHVLEKYIRTLGTKTNEYAEQFNRTEPNLNDLGLVFRDLHVHLPELAEYTQCVPSVPLPFSVDRYPKPKESNLNFLKPGSHEVVTRPMHVHEHLPPMYPEKERETPVVADTVEIRQNGIETPGPSSSSCQSPEISVTDSPEKHKDIFKRPIDPVSLPTKRPRLRLEEEERTREISSVMMTMSGFLSPAREGKLPEARAPTVISEKHERHKVNSHHPNPMKGPLPHPLERSEKKNKKSKLVNGKVMKNKRKDKSHKSESSKSKDSRLNKYPPGYPLKNKDIHPTHHNHVTMPAPKPPPGPPIPSPMMNLPATENIVPVIKQEPVELPASPVSRTVALPGEETIPVPRKIPISKSPLVANTHPVNKPLLSEVEIKREDVDNEEKLTSQPDRSKINIFKRITNKTKDDRNISEVVPDKSHSDILISRLQSEDGLRVDSKNHNSEYTKRHGMVNNNDSGAVDLSKHGNLTTNEVLNLNENYGPLRNYPEPLPIPMTVNKNSQLSCSKEIPGVSPKIKKEKKHKDKREKSIEKAAKLLKKQQLALSMAHVANPNLGNLKMLNTKPSKSSRPKSESKISHAPPAFPLFSNLQPGRSFMPPAPGLLPSDFLAGLTNNPLRLPHPNLLANPYALGGPGLIPGPNFLPGGMGPGMLPMSMGNFGHSSKSQARNIPPMLRRPSLEVIPVDNDMSMMNKSPLVPRDKDRHEKHKSNSIPNILQKHKKSHKEHHKSNMTKMPDIQPDITIELNPPRASEPIKEEPKVKTPSPEPLPVYEHERLSQHIPEVLPALVPVKVEKSEKKKDKSHKKEKKDKDGTKLKKKKDKKDKSKEKDKSEKKKDKEEKQEINRIKKEKKEKKKEKLIGDGLVPKLTLRLGTNSPMPPSSPDTFKLNIKPIVKKDDDEVEEDPIESVSRGHSRSPELAQISALVTRPPKQKHSSKQNHVVDEIMEPKSPTQSSNNSPPRKNRPPSSHSKYKRILFKPISKKGNTETYDDSESIVEPPAPPPGTLPSPYYMDEHGNKIWVCPACGRPDNGSPMIGCDGCDCWYHWVCVGISEEPGSAEDWFCGRCAAKREAMALAGEPTSSKKRGRKSKMDRVKDCH